MRYIGDVHGKFRQYKRIIAGAPASIQVGDMGVGFLRFPHGEPQANPPHEKMLPNHKYIRGNHDNPGVCRNQTQWIPDGHYNPDTGTMFIGGADSIDKALRIEGYSWWADEELSYELLRLYIHLYGERKPRILVTHDAPQSIAEVIILPKLLPGSRNNFEATRTRQAFQQMFQCHQPELWIFGHHHVSFDHVINGTRFICLAELEYKDIILESSSAR